MDAQSHEDRRRQLEADAPIVNEDAIPASEARRKLDSFVYVTLEIDPADAQAIACVRRDDVAYDECEPANADEIREHLEGVIEGIREEADPDA